MQRKQHRPRHTLVPASGSLQAGAGLPRPSCASLGITINMRIRIDGRNVTNKALPYTVLWTITRAHQSADRTIQRYHVPRLRGIEAEGMHAQLIDVVLPYANRAREDIQNPQEGVVRIHRR